MLQLLNQKKNLKIYKKEIKHDKENAWNKVYEETEKTYKVKGEDGKWTKVTENVTVLAQPGMKPGNKEIAFGRAIKKIKTEKPKVFTGDWTK